MDILKNIFVHYVRSQIGIPTLVVSQQYPKVEGHTKRFECIAMKSFYRVAKKVKPKKTNPLVINNYSFYVLMYSFFFVNLKYYQRCIEHCI